MGVIFKVPAIVIYVVGGLWGFFISLAIVTDELGFIGGAIALVLAPFTLTFAPWHAAIADNNWFPVGLVYGGGIAAWIFYAIGSAIDGD
jgi:hypothetical protein